MERDKNIGLKNVDYIKTELGENVTRIEIPNYDEIFNPSQSLHPFYTYHDKEFNKERYQYSTIPVHVGPFNINYNENNIINVLRCPIKNANSRTICLPKELSMFEEFIKFCCIYETSFNKRFEELYGHITVDYKEVKAGTTQRVPGWHVDGFQGSKFPRKHEIEHSYLWSSVVSTEFCPGPFFVSHIDESKYMIFDEMCKQATNKEIFQALDKNVYIFDPYMVHRSPVCYENQKRLLVRITFEYQKLLDPNDTINPALKFEIPYKYDIRNRLGEYTVPLDKNMYGWKN